MNISNTFCMNDIDDSSKATFCNYLLDCSCKRRIAEDVADNNRDTFLLCGITNLNALFRSRCDRLFEHKRISLFNSLHSRGKVKPVLRTDHCKVCDFSPRQQFVIGFIAVFFRNMVMFAHKFACLFVWVSNTDQFISAVHICVLCITFAAIASTD